MKTLISADEANAIQAQWMALDSSDPQAVKERVMKAMRELPQSFLSVSDSGHAQVMVQGMPSHAFPEPIAAAEKRARLMGVQTVLRWNCRGVWESANR